MFTIGSASKSLVITLIVIAGVLSINDVLAIDGDVEYSAPYIMVDPETGQIVTVNPGPRLKAHETPAELSVQDTAQAGTAALNAARASGTLQNGISTSPDTLPVTIAVLACLFMVVTGFMIRFLKEKRGT